MFKKILFLAVLTIISCDEQAPNKKNIDTPVVKKKNILHGINLDNYRVVRDTVEKRDNLASILSDYNIDYQNIHQMKKHIKNSFDLRKIYPDKSLILCFSKDSLNQLKNFIYEENQKISHIIHLEDSIYYQKYIEPTTTKTKIYGGVIGSSLWVTMQENNINPQIIGELSDIYAWTVDFFHIFKGDYFKIILDEEYVQDSIYTGNFNIKAGVFNFHGETLYAFKRTDENGKVGYYSHTGENLQRTFLKAPISYSRISSRYSQRRYHPVLHRWKSHKGTDYVARRGTPIKATANGIVTKSSYTSGNGKYVKIRHNSIYETQYLHMSRRAVRKGQRVRQGQVIGYVGSTGLATGPHVCYRFWKNGRQVDPYRQRLPKSKPLDKKLLGIFQKQINPLKTQLDQFKIKKLKQPPLNNLK